MMAATQSPAAPSSAPSPSSSSSFASRRPLARAALPPFTLPPPPEFPRPTAAASASSSTLSPPTPTPTPSAGGAAAQQPPTGSPYSTSSSPGFAAARSSSSSSTTALSSSSMLVHPQRASSHSPYEPHPRSGLSHPLNGGNLIQLSPRKPLPGGSSGQSSRSPPSRFTEKLPSIASLIPPPSQYGLPPRSPSQNGPAAPGPGSGPGLPAPGYLAMPPVKGPWGLGPPPASNPRYYHEFTVPEYPIARETSQQDRPFRCDLCTQCFSRNHDLKRHKRIHMAAKPFPCPTCNKSFSRRDALKRHRLVKACYKKSDSQAAGEGEPSRTSSSPDGEPEYTTAHWKPPEVALLEKLNQEKKEGDAKKDNDDVNDNAETETPKTPPRETGGEVEESQP